MRTRLLVTALIAFGLVASVGPGAVGSAEPYTVRVGVLNIVPDAPFLIADRKGYFKEEGLNVVFTSFNSAGSMVLPLSTGQLDVGGGAPAAGLYNGFTRGIKTHVVADRGSDAPGYGFNPLLVRKELVTSGRFKSPKDLRGMTFASNQPGSVSASSLYELLKKYGLALSDIKKEALEYPLHVAALQNGRVDASITAEPEATEAVHSGAAVRIMGNDSWYPNQQLSVVIYGDDFATKHHEEAKRFMRAYIKAVRFYYGALKGGHLAGPNAAEVIAILVQTTKLKDAAVYRTITPSAIDPDGRLNLASMRKDLQYFRDQQIVQGAVSVEDIVDESFQKEAVAELGPYKAPR